MMFEECHSCSESTSTNDSLQEVKTKWHSAEDVRERQVIRIDATDVNGLRTFKTFSGSFQAQSNAKKDEKRSNRRQTQSTHSDESPRSRHNLEIDIDKIVVLENKHFKMVRLRSPNAIAKKTPNFILFCLYRLRWVAVRVQSIRVVDEVSRA